MLCQQFQAPSKASLMTSCCRQVTFHWGSHNGEILSVPLKLYMPYFALITQIKLFYISFPHTTLYCCAVTAPPHLTSHPSPLLLHVESGLASPCGGSSIGHLARRCGRQRGAALAREATVHGGECAGTPGILDASPCPLWFFIRFSCFDYFSDFLFRRCCLFINLVWLWKLILLLEIVTVWWEATRNFCCGGQKKMWWTEIFTIVPMMKWGDIVILWDDDDGSSPGIVAMRCRTV